MLNGVNVYMAGIALQLFFILLFILVLWKLQRDTEYRRVSERGNDRVWILHAVLVLVSIRIVFRLIEYSRGINSEISRRELYVYCFDSVSMLVALGLFNVFHPGPKAPPKKFEAMYA